MDRVLVEGNINTLAKIFRKFGVIFRGERMMAIVSWYIGGKRENGNSKERSGTPEWPVSRCFLGGWGVEIIIGSEGKARPKLSGKY
jgi:hypothetical protein